MEKVLRILALLLSSVYILLLNSIWGIDDLVHGIMNVLSVDHQSLVESVLDLSFSTILS